MKPVKQWVVSTTLTASYVHSVVRSVSWLCVSCGWDLVNLQFFCVNHSVSHELLTSFCLVVIVLPKAFILCLVEALMCSWEWTGCVHACCSSEWRGVYTVQEACLQPVNNTPTHEGWPGWVANTTAVAVICNELADWDSWPAVDFHQLGSES